MYHNFIRVSVDGHLGCLHGLAIVNCAAVITGCMYPGVSHFLKPSCRFPYRLDQMTMTCETPQFCCHMSGFVSRPSFSPCLSGAVSRTRRHVSASVLFKADLPAWNVLPLVSEVQLALLCTPTGICQVFSSRGGLSWIQMSPFTTSIFSAPSPFCFSLYPLMCPELQHIFPT